MMIVMRPALIGIAAGAAAALLFASVLSGSFLSVILFYLAPLPIMIAALGWTHWTALIAAAAAALGLAVAFGTFFLPAFLIGIGLPAWWLGYLALLARSNGPGRPVEWYPPGRLVVWSAVLGALVVIAAVPLFGDDVATVRAALKSGFERMFRAQLHIPGDQPLIIPGIDDSSRFIDIIVIALPYMAATVTTTTHLFNLWRAAKVVKPSGHLQAPWPDLSAMRLPPSVLFALAAAIAGAFVLPGLFGLSASLFAASLLLAYALLGLSVLHAI